MEAVLAACVVLASLSGPLCVFLLLRFGAVGGTTRELAERDLELKEQAAEGNLEIARRRMTLEERRIDAELAERLEAHEEKKAAIRARFAGAVGLRNVEGR